MFVFLVCFSEKYVVYSFVIVEIEELGFVFVCLRFVVFVWREFVDL